MHTIRISSNSILTLLSGDEFVSQAEANPLLKEEQRIADSYRSGDRRIEFALGRQAARNSMKLLGENSLLPILRSSDGSPLFPPPYVGSISHTRARREGLVNPLSPAPLDLRAAALVSTTAHYRFIGLDIEFVTRELNPNVAPKVMTPSELLLYESGTKPQKRVRLLQTISAKEAFYKAFAPSVGHHFGFHTVALQWINSEREGFSEFIAQITQDLTPTLSRGVRVKGSVGEHGGVVITLICT